MSCYCLVPFDTDLLEANPASYGIRSYDQRWIIALKLSFHQQKKGTSRFLLLLGCAQLATGKPGQINGKLFPYGIKHSQPNELPKL